MEKLADKIGMYFRKGMYRKEHLEVLERKGILTERERKAIEQGK